jgi:hypothetical protein
MPQMFSPPICRDGGHVIAKSFTPLLLVFGMILVSPALAGEVVEIQVLQMQAAPATQPTTMPVADAELADHSAVVVSIETSPDSTGQFHANSTIAETRISLDGRVSAMPMGRRQLEVTFSCSGPGFVEEVTTNVVLSVNEQKMIGGSLGGPGERSILAGVKSRVSDKSNK